MLPTRIRPGSNIASSTSCPSAPSSLLRHSPSVACLGVKVREVIRILEHEGWQQVRQKGSHRQFQHPERPGVGTVAGAPADEVPKGTLASIWRQAQLRGQR